VEENTQLLQPDPGAVIPRISLSEQGVTGLRVVNKRILQEQVEAFRYPRFIRTVQEMRNNPTVGAAMNVYRMMMSRIEWDVKPPEGATEQDKARARAVKTMMKDMDHSWSSFIDSVIPYLEYGFSINEKVLRRRLKRNGSKHNDGLIGIKSLPIRGQETIAGWVFSKDGSELLGVEQSLLYVENAHLFEAKKNINGNIFIPRNRFLLLSSSATQGNPEGNSIFKNIYLAFKQLSLLQDQELLGITKDIQGILKIVLPPKYFDVNASADDKAVLTRFQQIIDNYNAGTQRGLLVPGMVDPETKMPMFTYDLMESKGGAKYDTEGIIRRLQGDILSALSVDVLKLGSDGSGSFSLAESKSSILALAIDYRMSEIKNALNNDLMRTIYEMNGWDTANMAGFDYADIEEVNLEVFAQAIQKIMSVSGVEFDRPVANRIREILKVPKLPDDEPVDLEKLPVNQAGTSSRSGDGMAVGTTGQGTAKNPYEGSQQKEN
jgi:hypothetical protein